MTERKRNWRNSRKKRLEAAGFEFEQIAEGQKNTRRWKVWLPSKDKVYRLRLSLPKTYKHLTTAVSAGIRQMERAKVRKDMYDDIGEDWETALKKFDEYKCE